MDLKEFAQERKPQVQRDWRQNLHPAPSQKKHYDKDCKVEIFDDDADWQPALLKVIRSKERIIAQIEKEEDKSGKERCAQNKEELELARFETDAKRLGLR